MKRRAAVEPVIGHIKNEHRMNRNYLAATQGDAINAILAAAGYNFQPPAQMAEASLAPLPRTAPQAAQTSMCLKIELFTTDKIECHMKTRAIV